MLNKKLIQRLRNGKIAVENDGTIEDLQQVLAEAFPTDDSRPTGTWDSYFRLEKNCWVGNSTTNLPSYSVKDFFKDAKQEKTFPRVMLVSDTNSKKKAVKRVIFMIKNGKYLGWLSANTIEESERVTETFSWPYAWEVKEQTFPITITEKQYNSLTNEQKELINQITQTK